MFVFVSNFKSDDVCFSLLYSKTTNLNENLTLFESFTRCREKTFSKFNFFFTLKLFIFHICSYEKYPFKIYFQSALAKFLCETFCISASVVFHRFFFAHSMFVKCIVHNFMQQMNFKSKALS